MTSPTNLQRAAWAEATLIAFGEKTGHYEDSLGDLLCDLMHWAEFAGLDFEATLDRARCHFEAEVQR